MSCLKNRDGLTFREWADKAQLPPRHTSREYPGWAFKAWAQGDDPRDYLPKV